MTRDFIWRDAGRTVVFRRRGATGAAAALRAGLRLVRAALDLARAGRRSRVGDAAAAIHEVSGGGVPEAAGAVLDSVLSHRFVALGGGRVIDTAKAVASVTGARVAAIPTTMSGAEMTGIHRLPAGAEDRVGALVRPDLVIADPEAMTSLPEPSLRAVLDERPRPRGRLPLHAVRQPSLADDRAARRRTDRRLPRPGARRSATAPPSPSARSSAATRSTRECSLCTT